RLPVVGRPDRPVSWPGRPPVRPPARLPRKNSEPPCPYGARLAAMPYTPPPAESLNARDLCDRLTRLYVYCRDRLHDADRDALKEAMRRVREHERLVREVVPDLRNRITELEQ